VPELPIAAWVALGAGALLVGFAKTAVGGLVAVAVAMYAAVLPAKASTGTLLVLLLVGDVVAVSVYRRDADWRALGRLIGPVLVGVVLGAVFIRLVDDATLKRAIGAIILALVAAYLLLAWRNKRQAAAPDAEAPQSRPRRLARVLAYGSLAGFCTMTANSGGAPMTLYMVSARYSMLRFLGTSAWFFFLVNLLKLPFSAGLGLISPSQLLLCAVLAPVVLAGAFIGRAVIGHLKQSWFDNLVVLASAVPAVFLLF
jgi:uncharacterized membrane protein YfcA